ncbi:UDP-glucosyltransferase 29-like [Ziziphus jujuba]|uniref:Glycosyltransferase n=1 Tax=Ziziphus jujuba TaxID=326968 RepID=A0ABM3ILE9_ZIZJJ|nr:UDP-glucosyltransferase 29-like [Ziziphus jujuba]
MMERQRSIKVLMFPWLAYGHISPSLELAKRLTNRNFQIYFCSTPVNLTSVKKKLSQKYSSSIKLVELHLPSLPDLPPHYHTTNGLPPNLMPTLKKAFDMSSPSFSTILSTIKPDLLIYDFVQPWAPQLASCMNIPAVNLMSFGAAMVSFLLHSIKYNGDDHDDEFLTTEFHLSDSMKAKLAEFIETSPEEHIDRAVTCLERSNSLILIRSFRELEGKYLDYVSLSLAKKVVSIGPLVVQDTNPEDDSMDIINWLDKKEKSSTVFVSFGSEYYLTNEEMEEIAYGLELSKVNFIWVVRFPLGQKMALEEALPKGFLERVGENGMVVEDWAPQMKILGHSSIGGFVSHCGCSSLMESLKHGVPIIAMPMQLDQPINAKLMERIGVGLEVKRDKNGRIEREHLAKVIREMVVEKSRKHIEKKAREMSDIIREKGEEEIDNVVEELKKLCGM